MIGTLGTLRVVVDASLADIWVLPERYSHLALALAEEWAQTGAEVVAPHLNLHAPYDAHYLAMAETHQREIWTGDERLYNAVRMQWPQIRWVGADSPPEADTESV